VMPTVRDGREVFVIRDPEELTDKSLIVSRDILFLLSLMDGSRSVADIQAEYVKACGVVIYTDRIMSVIQAMDENLLLSNSRYESCVTRLKSEYEALPFRSAFLRGRSYPDSREELKTYLERMMGRVPEGAQEEASIRGILAPHIDYERGKDIYAPTYRNLAFEDGTLFVVFGTCHKFAPRLWNISLKDLETPLGRMRNAELIGNLIEQDGMLRGYVDEWPHRNEHSIELQIPILQYLMEGRKYHVLPILTGSLHEYVMDGKSLEDGETRRLIEGLKAVLKVHPGPCVFIAAADLAHIGAQFGDAAPLDAPTLEESKRKDEALLKTIEAGDAAGFFDAVKQEEDRRRICGLAPIYFTLAMLEGSRGRLAGYQQWTDGASSVSFAGAFFS